MTNSENYKILFWSKLQLGDSEAVVNFIVENIVLSVDSVDPAFVTSDVVIITRVLVRAGATGAWAPAEI